MPRSPARPPPTPSTSPRPRGSSRGSRTAWSTSRPQRFPSPGSRRGRRSSTRPASGPGPRVLILGAAGGVGHLAVQIAKARGAYVIGTARAEKHAFLAALGADEPIDYTPGDFAGRVATWTSSSTRRRRGGRGALPALRDGGDARRASPSLGRGAARGRRPPGARRRDPRRARSGSGWRSSFARRRRAALHLTSRRTFPLEDAAGAHEAVETGRTKGKLVLTVG